MSRRAAAGAAAALLLALVLASQAWAELPRRWRSLRAFAPKELAVRRLGGSGTAFDRRFFSFLENARRRMPPWTSIVRLEAPRGESYLYLAAYYLAPLKVTVAPSANLMRRCRGCVKAVYGEQLPSNVDVLARLPEGYLVGEPP